MNKLNAQQLRSKEADPNIIKNIKKNPIYIILDNVLDTYNVGAIFRLADATACEKVYLCGQTETPPNPRIKKASINTWKWVAWSYVPTAIGALHELKTQFSKLKSIVVEQHSKSIPLSKLAINFPVVIIVGNETYGVSKDVLNIADVIVELPMFGINKSLNVMVTLGIVLYKLVELNE